MKHKMTPAVIPAGRGTLAKLQDPNNTLSKEEKDVLIGLSAAALIRALFNAEEVGAVGDALLQAACHDQELRAAAGQMKGQWDKRAAERDAAAGYEAAKNRLATLRAIV